MPIPTSHCCARFQRRQRSFCGKACLSPRLFRQASLQLGHAQLDQGPQRTHQAALAHVCQPSRGRRCDCGGATSRPWAGSTFTGDTVRPASPWCSRRSSFPSRSSISPSRPAMRPKSKKPRRCRPWPKKTPRFGTRQTRTRADADFGHGRAAPRNSGGAARASSVSRPGWVGHRWPTARPSQASA